MLLDTALSSRSVFAVYGQACKHVQDWTQAIEFGPFEQRMGNESSEPDEADGIGQCITDRLSTAEFFQIK